MTPNPFTLSQQEQEALQRFLTGEAAPILAAGGEWALVMKSTGIGIAVTATARHENTVVTVDITDFSCW